MRRRWLLTGLAVLGAIATGLPAAGADPGSGSSGGGVFLFASSGKLLALRDVPGTLTGDITVSFHGDAGAGCGLIGDCGYSGTATLDISGTQSELLLAYELVHGRHRIEALLALVDQGESAELRAVTNRANAGLAGGSCADAASPTTLSGGELPIAGNRIGVRLLDGTGTAFATRCAGPRDADLVGALPPVEVPASALAHGQRRVDLRGTRSFTGGGYSGTVRSTVVLRLGRGTNEQVSPETSDGGGATVRVRSVTVPIRLIGGDGFLAARIAGDASGGCTLLDACGATGTILLAPRPRPVSDTLVAYGSPRRPLRDFLTALGLARGGRTAGIQASADLQLTGGSEGEVFSQGGRCHDTIPFTNGLLDISGRRLELDSGLLPEPTNVFRCPGPQVLGPTLARGTLAPGQLERHRTTVTLRGVTPSADDGWRIAGSGAIRFTLVRGHPRVQIRREFSGAESGL